MHIVPALSSAVRGMSDASQRMDAAAQNVAADTTSPDADSGELVSDLVEATIVAPGAYTANATVARAAAEMQRHLLDIRA
jgi:flagellar basal body rod protein FlgC